MKRKTTAVLLLQRSEWFGEDDHPEAIVGLDEDGDRIALQLSPMLDIVTTRSISTIETAEAVSVELRSIETDLVILLYQTRVDSFYLERILKGVGRRPLVVWCYLPWRRIPSSMTYEDLVMGSSFYAMTESLAHLRALKAPYLAAFGAADDPGVLHNVAYFALAARVATDLRKIRLGVLAEPDSAAPDKLALLQRLGLVPVFIPAQCLQDFLGGITEPQITTYLQGVLGVGVESMVTDDTLRKAARVQLGLQALSAERTLDYLSVADHDAEFRARYGLCPGMPPSLDGMENTQFIPTRDLEAVISSVMLHQIAGASVFTMRMWFWDRAKNIIVGGNAGVQNPHGMAQGNQWIIGDYECQRGDPDGGAQVEFVAKPGRVTLLQVHTVENACMARAVSGVCLESEPWIEGIPQATVRLDCSIDYFLGRISETGGSPYWIMVYGSHVQALKALFELQSIDFEILQG